MDVIKFSDSDLVLYRPVGSHSYAAGVCGVESVTPTEIPLPRESRPASITNLCGAFRAPFYKDGREALLVQTSSFGGYNVIHHLDGLLQVCSYLTCCQPRPPTCPYCLPPAPGRLLSSASHCTRRAPRGRRGS